MTEPSDIETALAELGVTKDTLTDEERHRLNEDSYLLFESLMDDAWLDAVRSHHERLMVEKYGPVLDEADTQRIIRERSEEQGEPGSFNHGSRRWFNMVDEGEIFERMYTHPRVLAAVHQIIETDFRLHSVNGRDALPGLGEQGLHADVVQRNPGEPFNLANSAWLLDPFTEETGPTRVVPGTQDLPQKPQEDGVNPEDQHPNQRLIFAPAGSVLVFNAHLWHSGTRNRSPTPRRVIHCAFARRHVPQEFFQKETIRKSTYNRLSPTARYLLDV